MYTEELHIFWYHLLLWVQILISLSTLPQHWCSWKLQKFSRDRGKVSEFCVVSSAIEAFEGRPFQVASPEQQKERHFLERKTRFFAITRILLNLPIESWDSLWLRSVSEFLVASLAIEWSYLRSALWSGFPWTLNSKKNCFLGNKSKFFTTARNLLNLKSDNKTVK